MDRDDLSMRNGSPIQSHSGLWFDFVLISGMWGSSFLFIKLINNTIPPFSFATIRGFIAMVALLVWLVFRRSPRSSSERSNQAVWQNVCHMVVLGTTNGWLANAMTVTALRYLDSALVAIVLATVPLLVAVLGHFAFAEERFQLGRLFGVSVGFIGALLVIGPLAVFGGRGSLVGIVAMLVTAFSYACGTLYGRFLAGTDVAIIACGQQAVGGIVGGIIALLSEPPSIITQPIRTWLLLAIIGVLCSALPTALYLRLLGRTTSVAAGSIALLQPVWAMMLGWMILGERISAGALFGAMLIIFGIVMASRPAR
jgi:drug/metabolite transporter (DMT)-like permease